MQIEAHADEQHADCMQIEEHADEQRTDRMQIKYSMQTGRQRADQLSKTGGGAPEGVRSEESRNRSSSSWQRSGLGALSPPQLSRQTGHSVKYMTV